MIEKEQAEKVLDFLLSKIDAVRFTAKNSAIMAFFYEESVPCYSPYMFSIKDGNVSCIKSSKKNMSKQEIAELFLKTSQWGYDIVAYDIGKLRYKTILPAGTSLEEILVEMDLRA